MKTTMMLLAGAGLMLIGNLAWAQRDAASKIDGAAYEAPYFYDTVGAYQGNAYSHGQVLQQATSYGVSVPQAVAKEHTDAIRANLKAASKHHVSLRQAVKDKKTADKHLSDIEAHHKAALAACDQIDAACASGKGDAAAVGKLSSKVTDELKAAHDKHKQVAEHLTTKK